MLLKTTRYAGTLFINGKEISKNKPDSEKKTKRGIYITM